MQHDSFLLSQILEINKIKTFWICINHAKIIYLKKENSLKHRWMVDRNLKRILSFLTSYLSINKEFEQSCELPRLYRNNS